MNKMIFKSVFSKEISDFIAEKQALGYKYSKAISLLLRFDQFVLSYYPDQMTLSKEIVLDWTKKSDYETIGTQNGRISIMRGLAQYMIRIGGLSYIYPPQHNTINRYHYIPYIFSEDQMGKILRACDNYSKSNNSPYIHLVVPAIIRLLYGCGLRISEALNLRITDVIFQDNLIKIYDTKFNKERLIPMVTSLSNHLRNYSEKVHNLSNSSEWFFPSPCRNNSYCSSTIYGHFRKLLKVSGIPHTGKGPRLHDIRHTFAVHCLKKWVLENRDLNNCLPYLSIYLGHQDLRGTQHYLRLTADMYPVLINKVEIEFSSVIPEVKYYERD